MCLEEIHGAASHIRVVWVAAEKGGRTAVVMGEGRERDATRDGKGGDSRGGRRVTWWWTGCGESEIRNEKQGGS